MEGAESVQEAVKRVEALQLGENDAEAEGWLGLRGVCGESSAFGGWVWA